MKHQHHRDSNYNNVILHVVWENDLGRDDKIPILELKDRVSKILLDRYGILMNATDFIACSNRIHEVHDITWKSWKERMLAERLMRKSKIVEGFLQQSNFHWEESFWWLLARNFGITVNGDAFEALARSIPLSMLAKHKNQVILLEALLLGQCGLLDPEFDEDYPRMLKKEYDFYRTKYQLRPIPMPVFFLRMRPGNFPTIRLAQLAMLVHHSAHLFSRIKEANSIVEIIKWFDVTANDYWHYHYSFDQPSPFKKKKLGTTMINNVIINTIVPMIFAYGDYHGEEKYKLRALQWLEETEAENNSITAGFAKLNFETKTAYDSQAFIELKTQYCDKRKCLDCSVGNFLLKS
jgi:hypothetical protein